MKPTNFTPVVSVVIPVYNTKQEYLEKCFEGIKKQTHRDFECIIVNDGSSDATKTVIKDAIKEDKKFKLINSIKNMGSAHARNIGLKKAKGEFVIFLDADDEYDKDLLETVYKKASKSDSDITIFDYFINDPNIDSVIKRNPGEDVIMPKDTFVLIDIKRGAFNIFANALFNKMYKRSFLIDNNVEFDTDLRRAQDALFVTESLTLAKSIIYIEEYLYTYNVDVEGSAWQTISKYPYCGLQYLEKLHNFLQEKNLYKKLQNSYGYTFITNADYMLNKLIPHQEQFISAYHQTKELIKRFSIKQGDQADYIDKSVYTTAQTLIDNDFNSYLLLKLKEQNWLINHSKNTNLEKSRIIEELNKVINGQQATNKQLQSDNQHLNNEINRPKGIKESTRQLNRALKRRANNDPK